MTHLLDVMDFLHLPQFSSLCEKKTDVPTLLSTRSTLLNKNTDQERNKERGKKERKNIRKRGRTLEKPAAKS